MYLIDTMAVLCIIAVPLLVAIIAILRKSAGAQRPTTQNGAVFFSAGFGGGGSGSCGSGGNGGGGACAGGHGGGSC